MALQRDQLGETVTEWLADHASIELTDIVVTQSSDARFHCVTISIFYRESARQQFQHLRIVANMVQIPGGPFSRAIQSGRQANPEH